MENENIINLKNIINYLKNIDNNMKIEILQDYYNLNNCNENYINMLFEINLLRSFNIFKILKILENYDI